MLKSYLNDKENDINNHSYRPSPSQVTQPPKPPSTNTVTDFTVSGAHLRSPTNGRFVFSNHQSKVFTGEINERTEQRNDNDCQNDFTETCMMECTATNN